jgi:hypothetical protein
VKTFLTNFIRDLKIAKNHNKRVRSIAIRSNEEIVRMLDQARSQHLEAERLEVKDETIRWKAIADTLEWLINGEAK